MLDIAAFCVFGPEKFPTRRQVIKKRTHVDLSSWRFTAVAHNVDLAAVDDDFRADDGIRFPRG